MGLDSVELVMGVEKYFSISIPDREAEKAATVGRLVNCVASIKGIQTYNFALRETTFKKIQGQLINKSKITDQIGSALEFNNQKELTELESKIGLKLPGLKISSGKSPSLFSKFKNWIGIDPIYDFQKTVWKRYIDVILSYNLERVVNPTAISSKYEIYLAIMRLTADKIGVDYFEIGLEKSFTDDLGVD